MYRTADTEHSRISFENESSVSKKSQETLSDGISISVGMGGGEGGGGRT
jgi:hypothetical protein